MTSSNLVIKNVRLVQHNRLQESDLWTIQCLGGRVSAMRRLGASEDPGPADIDGKGSLLLPSLCHSHIHLDKCFILDRCELVNGDFNEALKVTNEAKASFGRDDLYRRGWKLIRDSLECGVTSMRAHVEIDTTVEFLCLQVGLELCKAFSNTCDIQLAAFAQEPLFNTADATEPGRNYDLLVQAAGTQGVHVVGSAPYVEPTTEQAKANIALVLKLAQEHGHYVDFHLDYNLDPASEPLIFEVISAAKRLSWSRELNITIGHATRMQLFTPAQWRDLVVAIGELPIIFVGLPNSDLYMLGREASSTPLGPPRSTLRIPYIANEYGIEMAMSTNNLQNAFTPQGSVDPLSLCTLGVALFQSATLEDLRTLVRSVTLTSKRALGQKDVPEELSVSTNDRADFVILHGTPNLQSAALNPAYDRTTIRGGIVVARRFTTRWFAESTA
ncbi:hypothetical protein B0H16DRAFT_303541 [Mycena metata]|uniref:Cytosine deaminase n=1 Tax=Mycena metata TaxID=1033252 RepID=A0AAD7KFK5_9AGAR|nr:hypothetical protein B0H16DRAFT_303541 [Mycena metata]